MDTFKVIATVLIDWTLDNVDLEITDRGWGMRDEGWGTRMRDEDEDEDEGWGMRDEDEGWGWGMRDEGRGWGTRMRDEGWGTTDLDPTLVEVWSGRRPRHWTPNEFSIVLKSARSHPVQDVVHDTRITVTHFWEPAADINLLVIGQWPWRLMRLTVCGVYTMNRIDEVLNDPALTLLMFGK